MKSKIICAIFAGTCACLAANHVLAASSTINWLDLTSRQAGGAITSGSTFNLPGYGPVEITYTSTTIGWERGVDPTEQNGSVTSGGNTFSWSTYNDLNGVNFASAGTMLNYSITYSFLNGPLTSGTLVLGSEGFANRALDSSSNFSAVDVADDATFLGDFDQGLGFGATDFIGSAGEFSLSNSVAGPTNFPTSNSWGNTNLGVILIDDSVSSITLNVQHIGQDGIGFNVGIIAVPEPASLLMLSLSVLALTQIRSRPN